MEQRSNYAAMWDEQLQLKLKKEECAEDMERRSNYAAKWDVRMEPRREG